MERPRSAGRSSRFERERPPVGVPPPRSSLAPLRLPSYTHKMLCGLVFHVRPASTARASSLELTPASLAGPQHPPPHRRHRRDACESPSRTSLLRDTALTARTRPQYYNWPALSTRTFATDLASVSQYVGAVSGAAATAVFIILVFLRGGVGSCTTLTAGLAAVRPDLPPRLSGRFAVHAR